MRAAIHAVHRVVRPVPHRDAVLAGARLGAMEERRRYKRGEERERAGEDKNARHDAGHGSVTGLR